MQAQQYGEFVASLFEMDEPQVKAAVISRLEADFDIRPEVEGVNILEKRPVVVDFILEAKPHLVSLGFPRHPIPLEVKQLSDKDNKSVRAVWQCITYAQSEFGGERPPFVLLFPKISHFMKNGKECEHAACLQSLISKANVGELSFSWNGEWVITFSPHHFFSLSRGLGTKHHVAYKRYVGTWK